MLWEQTDIVHRFAEHYETARGKVRAELVDRQVSAHVRGRVGRVVDVGGGEGEQALRWAARGCEVTLVEPSTVMLAAARRWAEKMPESVRDRISYLCGTSADAAARLPPHSFDLVMSHGVLMYLDDPRPFLADLAALCRPGGTVSVCTKNADSLAMRPGLQGDFRTALESLDQRATTGWLGVTTRGDSVAELSAGLAEQGVNLEQWYGVGVFTDHDPDLDDLSADGAADLMELEWQASGRDPYRGVARLVHLIGHADATSR